MIRCLTALLLLASSACSMAATCTSETTWPTLTASTSTSFGKSFDAGGTYADCYSFHVQSTVLASGLIVEGNQLFDRLMLDVTSMSLFSGDVTAGQTNGMLILTDSTPDILDSLFVGPGTYTLVVNTTVIEQLGLFTSPVGYAGRFDIAGQATGSVPEPSSMALALAALLGMGGLAGALRRLAG